MALSSVTNMSSHMNKYEQYHIQSSSQSMPNKYGTDVNGSLLRSLLSAPPSAGLMKVPIQTTLARPCSIETDLEWTHSTRVPFNSYCRIKWTWTKSAEEYPNYLNTSNDQKMGTRVVVFQPQCPGPSFASFETFAAMGDRPLRKNALTYWEVEVSSHVLRNATSIMVGVGTKQAKKRSIGYLNLIGADQHSWGLSNKGQLWHNGQSISHCDPLGCGDQDRVVIGLLYDALNGHLSFFLNGKRTGQGVAFKGLCQHEQLYPMISSTASNSRFILGPVHQSMPTLRDLSRDAITSSLSPNSWNQQNLPKSLVDFLNSEASS